jgi:peroxiredoxin
VVVIGINTGEEGEPQQKARAFQQKHGLTYPILLDEKGTVSAAYRVQGLPTNVIIDREGKVRYIDAGFNASAIGKKLQELGAQP